MCELFDGGKYLKTDGVFSLIFHISI